MSFLNQAQILSRIILRLMNQRQENLKLSVPPKDYELAQKLISEVGNVPGLIFKRDSSASKNWFNQDLKDSEMAVRKLIRDYYLASQGYQENDDWMENGLFFLNSYSKTIYALGDTGVDGYNWSYGRWKRGASITGPISYYEHERKNITNPKIDVKQGIVLFTDELQQLAKRQSVTTLHSIIRSNSHISIKKEVFAVDRHELFRLRGLIEE